MIPNTTVNNFVSYNARASRSSIKAPASLMNTIAPQPTTLHFSGGRLNTVLLGIVTGIAGYFMASGAISTVKPAIEQATSRIACLEEVLQGIPPGESLNCGLKDNNTPSIPSPGNFPSLPDVSFPDRPTMPEVKLPDIPSRFKGNFSQNSD